MRSQTNKDLVLGRGPVSGTGEALSDKEALEILDERIESPRPSDAPDIGVVIDPEKKSATEGHPQQVELLDYGKWVSPIEAEPLPAAASHVIKGRIAFEQYADAFLGIWKQSMPRCIVAVPNPQTPLIEILDRSFDPWSKEVLQARQLASPLRLRVMVEDAVFDVTVSPTDAAKPGFTLRDLLEETGPRWISSYEP